MEAPHRARRSQHSRLKNRREMSVLYRIAVCPWPGCPEAKRPLCRDCHRRPPPRQPPNGRRQKPSLTFDTVERHLRDSVLDVALE